MSDEILHLAGPVVVYDNVRRQRCVWCGALIDERPLERLARVLEPGEDPDNPEPWEPAVWEGWVAVSGTSPRVLSSRPEPPDAKAPERSCMRLMPTEIGAT